MAEQDPAWRLEQEPALSRKSTDRLAKQERIGRRSGDLRSTPDCNSRSGAPRPQASMNVIPWNPRNQDRRNQKRKHSGLRNKGINKDNDAADLGTQIANKTRPGAAPSRPIGNTGQLSSRPPLREWQALGAPGAFRNACRTGQGVRSALSIVCTHRNWLAWACPEGNAKGFLAHSITLCAPPTPYAIAVCTSAQEPPRALFPGTIATKTDTMKSESFLTSEAAGTNKRLQNPSL